MGFLADFVKDKMQKEHENRMMQMDAWTKLAGDPSSSPETKQWAFENLTGFPDVKKHIKGPEAASGLFGHLKGLIGLKDANQGSDFLPDIMASKAPEMLNPQQPAPSPIRLMSPEEQAQGAARVSAIEASQDTTNEINKRVGLLPVKRHEAQLDTDMKLEALDRLLPAEIEKAKQTALATGEVQGQLAEQTHTRLWAQTRADAAEMMKN